MNKILHQIWIGPNKIPEREKQFSLDMKAMNPEFTYHLWTNENLPIDDAPENFKIQYQEFYETEHYAFCADILRLWVVYKFGGMYLDIDFEPVKPILEFTNVSGIVFYHPNDLSDPDFTIVNGAFGFTKGHPIPEYCIERIKVGGWWYGPEWFGRTIKEYLGIPYAVPHMFTNHLLGKQNIWYFDWDKFHSNWNRHHALYSWSDQYIPEK